MCRRVQGRPVDPGALRFRQARRDFDRCSVSFVSITQQFNTTTSMGRLTLNILLSFAQFERELIGERVRDKVAASKKKGMWMGGTVPLGYDAKDRKLVVNKAEARRVEDIYRRYLRLKSVPALKVELDAAGIRSKGRARPDGTEHGNQQFSQGALYLLLQNRTYRGEATHRGKAYPGEHAAVVDKPLWDAVQAVLAENRVQRTTGANTKVPSLLTGMLFDEAGERLTPTWSVKKGTRYRYYVSTSLVKGGSKTPSTRRRIPAGNLETIVIERLRRLFSSRGELLDAIEGASNGRTGQGQLISAGVRSQLSLVKRRSRTDQSLRLWSIVWKSDLTASRSVSLKTAWRRCSDPMNWSLRAIGRLILPMMF